MLFVRSVERDARVGGALLVVAEIDHIPAASAGSAQIYKSGTSGISGAFNLLASSSTIGVQTNGTKDPLAAFPPLVSATRPK